MKEKKEIQVKVKNSLDAIGSFYTSNYWETETQISKYHTKGGHGFAAEDANTLIDKLSGKNAKVIGKDNIKNGADRIVNGKLIQTKYYKTPQETINSAFDSKTGLYRYKGQVLEVPADQYEKCIELMEQKIREGKVPGIKDPAKAKELIKKGRLTYKQATNIAKAGTIESLIYDATNQAVVCTHVLGLSFVVSFALAKLQGTGFKEATQIAFNQAVEVAGKNFVSGIITSQLLKTKLAAKGTVCARYGIKAIAKTNLGKKTIEQIAKASLGKPVYGASAINHVSKLLRTNIIVASVTTVITTGPDFYKALIEESMTWNQVFKNLCINISSITGGIAGAEAGAAIGSVFLPGFGTVAGGLIGGLAGSFLSQFTSKFIMDKFIEDDIEKIQKVFKDVFIDLGTDYLLLEEEFNQLVEKFATNLKEDKKFWKSILKKHKKEGYKGVYQYAYSYGSKICEEIVKKRKHIKPPDISDLHFET